MIERQYHKGEWCKLINSTCQEGYCDCCEPFLNKEGKTQMKLLFICAGNAQRSPTFEKWFKENKPQYEVKSTGTAYGYPERMTTELLEWADKIFLMDLEQEMFMKRKFPEFLYKTEIIGCSDQYSRDSPQLKELIWYWANKKCL